LKSSVQTFWNQKHKLKLNDKWSRTCTHVENSCNHCRDCTEHTAGNLSCTAGHLLLT